MTGWKSYLARWGVPGVESTCNCQQAQETIHHILLFCPDRAQGRGAMIAEAGTRDLQKILTTPKGIQAVSKWIFKYSYLCQFTFARSQQLETRSIQEWYPLQTLDMLDSAV